MEEQRMAVIPGGEGFLARRVKGMKRSDIRDAFTLTERPEVISLAGGFPDESAFPLDEVRGLIDRLLAREGGRPFQYGPTEGVKELRLHVADEMAGLGISASPEAVLLTGGSQQALDLVGKVLLDPEDVVLTESPGYVGGLSAFAAYEARLVGVALDGAGLLPDELERQLRRLRQEGRRVKLLYLVPTFQNPTGACLPAERRAVLLDLARRYDFLIVEDDPYREIWFDAPPPRPLAAADDGGRVIYLGSFSKVFLPGLRVGWIAGAPWLIENLTLAKQPADLCSNIFGQKLVEGYLAEGLLRSRVPLLREEYRRRRDALHEALAGEGLPLAWQRPSGGFFLWPTLPEGLDARRVLTRAAAEGVAFVPGEAFHVDGGGQRSLRLAYSQTAPDRLREGAARLGRAIRAELAGESRICTGSGQMGGYAAGARRRSTTAQ